MSEPATLSTGPGRLRVVSLLRWRSLDNAGYSKWRNASERGMSAIIVVDGHVWREDLTVRAVTNGTTSLYWSVHNVI